MNPKKQRIIHIGMMLALLALLSVLLLMIFGDRSAEAHNVRTLAQLNQYMTALELVRTDTGRYPGPDTFVCLGDYSDDACWGMKGTSVSEDAEVNQALVHYLPLLSAGKMVESEERPDQSREGYIYRQLKNGRSYEIQYFLMGTNKDCGFGDVLTAEIGEAPHYENTWCQVIR